MARSEDLKTVQDLNSALFQSDADKDKYLNHDWPYQDGENYFRKIISGETGVCFIAEDSTGVVGYLAGCIEVETPQGFIPTKWAELENMYVKPEARSLGVGSALTKEFVTWCKQNKVDRLKVSAYAANTEAIAFYRKNGFKPFSEDLTIDF